MKKTILVGFLLSSVCLTQVVNAMYSDDSSDGSESPVGRGLKKLSEDSTSNSSGTSHTATLDITNLPNTRTHYSHCEIITFAPSAITIISKQTKDSPDFELVLKKQQIEENFDQIN